VTTEQVRWLEAHIAAAPAVLRSRILERALAQSPADDLALGLARCGEQLLAQVERHPGDRRTALDLLAADALVTLALLAQAEFAPGGLDDFAVEVLRATSGAT
jgi:hypothetical protein